MRYAVSGQELTGAQGALSPELRAQLALLLATPEGSVVLDRGFGVKRDYLDSPPPIAQNMLASDLAGKIERYIPELALVEVELREISPDGKLHQKVVVGYADESI